MKSIVNHINIKGIYKRNAHGLICGEIVNHINIKGIYKVILTSRKVGVIGRYCEHIKYDNSYIIPEHLLEDFQNVKQIKPFSSFKKNYPEISIKKYLEF